ncbi:YsnF/AvaK domain-containing protein [Curtobacterium sp. Leaf261]|uniref:YsnF/AvaK domain-containing protein n=1 Tax=Curtobacterium sp. Leaf261 TaxID=1736311 RepID=UPI0006F7FA1D|nr:YsnF/AvaK domain-containing protein [Curtobacterium sp. Leaf261]KQO62687.1 hypothetical protein ASF23_06890 [Curtobacterium sp. Leaf261]
MTDARDVAVVRHEEQLRVSTDVVATERVRLERVVVTEQRTITVDVSHEEIRLTREPIVGGGPVPADAPAARGPVVVVLHEERIALVRTVVPVERVTMTTRSVTEDVLVAEDLRYEDVDVERTQSPE